MGVDDDFREVQGCHGQAWKGNSHLYNQGAYELQGVTGALFSRWDIKLEAGVGRVLSKVTR